MKVSIKIMAMLFMAATFGLTSCGDDDDDDTGTSDMIITAIEAAGVDLYGATTATDVPTNADITITFSADVNETTTDAVMLMHGTDEVTTTTSTAGSVVTLSPDGNLNSGASYTLHIEGVESTGGVTVDNTTVEFTTEGIGVGTPPQSSAQTLYLQLNGDVEDLVGNASMVSRQNTWVEDRFGNADAAAYFNGATTGGDGDIIELTGGDFVNSSTTISVWFKIPESEYPQGGNKAMFGIAAERGYFAEMGDNGGAWVKIPTSHKLYQDPSMHYFGTDWTDVNGDGTVDGKVVYDYTGDISAIIGDDEWTQLVITYNSGSKLKTIYLNGIKMVQTQVDKDATEWYLGDLAIADMQDGTGDPVAGIERNLTLGYFASPGNTATGWVDYSTATNTFVGAMDDFRIFSVALTESEVSAFYNAEKAD